MSQFPFTAIVGADDMALALIITTISPEVGGVLVRGEKGTAKSTMVRALADVLPGQDVITACRFGCDPVDPDPACPDGPHSDAAESHHRPARVVELPVGATEDRVIGSLDLGHALGSGQARFEPGLLAKAHRSILYVDEVNLLHDHLVDVLLDAAAMGRNHLERDGLSIAHQARIVLIGSMNPEEGELRPQLLDRFGLTVELAASRDPQLRADIVRRRLAFDADPQGFTGQYTQAQADLTDRIVAARESLGQVQLSDWALRKIAVVCAGFDVDGMRADIVTARAAVAHAAWAGRAQVSREDIRVAARLALPHRRRRNPFDAPGLDEDLLDQLLGDDEPPDDSDQQAPPSADPPADSTSDDPEESAAPEQEGQQPPGGTEEAHASPQDATDEARADNNDESQPGQTDDDADQHPDPDPATPDDSGVAVAPVGVVAAGDPYRIRPLTVRGVGKGESGRRSRALTSTGRSVGATARGAGRVHLVATINAAATRSARLGYPGAADTPRLARGDLRRAITQGRESNLVLLAVDASGSMAAQRRMSEVKTAVLSMLVDAYQRRDRVGVVTFGGATATVALPPTSSVEAAARCLSDLGHGGRTPLAEGLVLAAKVLSAERIRDPRRRALLVLVTDGRATSGPDALARARDIADQWAGTGVQAVVVDCEAGKFRMNLAGDLARRMGAEHIALGEIGASALFDIVHERRVA